MARRDAAEASGRFLDEANVMLITIHLPDGDAYACDQRHDFVSRGITFLPGIQISMPQDDGKPPEVTLTVPNVGNAVANLIEIAEESIALTLELVSDTAPDIVRERYRGLMTASGKVLGLSAEFTLRQDIPVDEPVSGLRANGQNFPGVEYAFP